MGKCVHEINLNGRVMLHKSHGSCSAVSVYKSFITYGFEWILMVVCCLCSALSAVVKTERPAESGAVFTLLGGGKTAAATPLRAGKNACGAVVSSPSISTGEECMRAKTP